MKVTGLKAAELNITDERILQHENIRFLNVREVDELRVYGLYDHRNGEHFKRLPEDVAEKVSEGVRDLNFHTAGGRVRFITDSDVLAIRSYFPSFSLIGNMSATGSSGFDVYITENGKERFLGIIRPFGAPVMTPHDFGDGTVGMLGLPKGRKQLTINMPIHNRMDKLYIGLDEGSSLEKSVDYKYEKPVLYYGSSITQGLCASRPGMAYEAQISRNLNCNFVNLGFAGKCLAEPVMADYIATLDPSVFVYDYDHNSTNHQQFINTHESLYLKFRAAHPDTPVIFVGRPDFWLKGYLNAPLPETNREVLYETYKNAAARGERVYYVDGYSLFDGEDREECTTDLIHPNDLGMYRMANNIGRYVAMALSDTYKDADDGDIIHP